MSKKKIGVIGLKGLPAFGGAATVGENLIEQLKDDYEFTVYSISSHTDEETGDYKGYRQIVFKEFPIKAGKLNIISYYIKSMLHALFVENYDLIHLHHNITGVITPLLRLRYNTLTTFHSVPEDIRENFKSISWLIKTAEQVSLNTSNIITCVAKSTYDKFSNSKNYENICYIPNGVNEIDLEKINSNITKSPDIMFAAGRILLTKSCHIMLKSLKTLNYEGKVYIAGRTDFMPEYEERLYELAKGLNVKFLGLIKGKQKLFSIIRGSSLFIFPSSIEAMSTMLLEVASLKVPIIASDITENKDIFNSEEVLYFNTNDSRDLAEKIEWANEHPEEMTLKAERAYRKVQEKYTWSKIAERYKDLYEDLLQ